MKKLLIILVLFSVVFGAFASGGSDDGKTTVGFTYHGAGDVFQNILKDEFVAYAKTKGVEVNVIDPQYDIQKQIEAVETFISLGVDAIVISPLDANGVLPALKSAQKAGIPLIALNAELNVGSGEPGYWYAGSANYDAGVLEGEYMAKALPKGAKIVYLRGTEGMEHTNSRRKGIQDALLDKRPDVELLAEQTANYDRAEGLKVMEDWIQAFPQIDGVLAANDQMALGALEAFKAAGMSGKYIAGIDGTDEAKQNVKNGTFTVTILQDAPGQSKAALDAVVDILSGKDVSQRVIVPFKTISKENVDQFM